MSFWQITVLVLLLVCAYNTRWAAIRLRDIYQILSAYTGLYVDGERVKRDGGLD